MFSPEATIAIVFPPASKHPSCATLSQPKTRPLTMILPSLQILIDMARILGVSTDYLLGVENETKQILDVSDLTSEEISSVSSVIDCFRKSHQK